jgi:hypothetical protein
MGWGVLTPPQYSTTTDKGLWHFVQIITDNRTFTDDAGNISEVPFNGVRGLDTTYPYNSPDDAPAYTAPPSACYPADGSLHASSDSPGNRLDPPDKSEVVNSQFETYVMYRPPVKAGFSDDWVSWVGIHRIDWSWEINLTRTGPTWTTYTPTLSVPRKPVDKGIDATWYGHPFWNVRTHL